MVMENKSSWIPRFDWLNWYKITYAYIYDKRIIVTEIKSSWMPKSEWQNKENMHMNT